MGIAKLKAKAGPHLARHELDWDVHIMPLLEKVDTVDELREAAADPRGFLSQLLASSECDQAEQGAITRLADQLLAGAQGKIAAGTELEGDVREPQVASADKKEAESDDPSRTPKLALASHAESVV
jgi:hypothetical protein